MGSVGVRGGGAGGIRVQHRRRVPGAFGAGPGATPLLHELQPAPLAGEGTSAVRGRTQRAPRSSGRIWVFFGRDPRTVGGGRVEHRGRRCQRRGRHRPSRLCRRARLLDDQRPGAGRRRTGLGQDERPVAGHPARRPGRDPGGFRRSGSASTRIPLHGRHRGSERNVPGRERRGGPRVEHLPGPAAAIGEPVPVVGRPERRRPDDSGYADGTHHRCDRGGSHRPRPSGGRSLVRGQRCGGRCAPDRRLRRTGRRLRADASLRHADGLVAGHVPSGARRESRARSRLRPG